MARSPTKHRVALAFGLAAAAALLLYATALASLWVRQERLLFHPLPLPADHAFAFAPDVHERWVEVPGARLDMLQLRLPHPAGVVFLLHGNAGNLETWFGDADFYRRLNLDLVMFDYRGYGKSSGRIENEAQLEADVRAAWAAVAPEYAGRPLVIVGRSLGSGLAAALAAELQPARTVLISPYFSMAALAAEKYPWVPSALLRYPLRTDEVVGRIRGSVLIVHGDGDTLIPVAHARRLLERAPHARLVVVPGAGHSDVVRTPAYREALERFLTAQDAPADAADGADTAVSARRAAAGAALRRDRRRRPPRRSGSRPRRSSGCAPARRRSCA